MSSTRTILEPALLDLATRALQSYGLNQTNAHRAAQVLVLADLFGVLLRQLQPGPAPSRVVHCQRVGCAGVPGGDRCHGVSRRQLGAMQPMTSGGWREALSTNRGGYTA